MTILPLDPVANASAQALTGFLSECRDTAAQTGRAHLVSITLPIESLDPLAVLESIFEPAERHFYAERPSERRAIAAAESVLTFTASGPGRFAACQRFVDQTLDDALVVGPQDLPLSGPHFFATFAFLDDVGGEEPFEAARLFVPRWQVAHRDDQTVAVANLMVDAESHVDEMAARIYRAYAKFGSFDYSTPGFVHHAPTVSSVNEVGGGRSYETAVSRAVQRIGRGDFEKIVLARAKDVRAESPLNPLWMLNGLRQRYPDCTAFSISNGRGQSFIGASPEMLVTVEDGVVSTEALAGSAGRGATASEDAALGSRLLRSEKDVREQRIVLDSILRRLGPLGVEMRYPTRPLLKRLSNVQHLHTPLEGRQPRGVRVLDFLAALHPTPAVGGTPREVAVPVIAELEAFPRGLYGGAFGWLDSRGGGKFFVNLRSALVDGAKARMYAGAGIVAGSSPELEFAETELKFRAMQDAFLGS